MYNLFRTRHVKWLCESLQIPVCIIDKRKNILWRNLEFSKVFVNTDAYFDFKVKDILKDNYVEYKDDFYKIDHKQLGNNFILTFYTERAKNTQWIKNVPCPVALCNEDYIIIDFNAPFQAVLDVKIGGRIKDYANKLDLNQENQEILCNSKHGMIPMLIWVYNHDQYKILFLEHRAEFIKLRNQAHASQHLQILGQLASSIIHDFNNLLTAINGFTEILENDIGENAMLNEIKRNTSNASDLSKELLNFVKEKPAEKKSTNLCEFLNSRKIMLQKLIGWKIKLIINADEKGYIDISETQLEQIILNMTMNSKDAMPDGGTFSISIKKMLFSEPVKINNAATLEKGQYFRIDIEDNGHGIPEEYMSKVFTPFFSTKEKGTGLGLASCLRIIQHANGAITLITSSYGTKFSIYLPVGERCTLNPEHREEEANQENNTTKKTLVLVEDEEAIRNLAIQALASEGYIVKAFDNGLQALNAIRTEHVDGLITDAVVPGLDGAALAMKVRQTNNSLPILIVSGYSYEDLEKNLPKDVHYLAKPFTLKILKEKVKTIFN